MSLRDEAIMAYEAKRAAAEKKADDEKREHIARYMRDAHAEILKAFALVELPHIVVTYNETSYWPEMAFEIDGIMFNYDLDNSRFQVKVSCPKCGGEWMRRFKVPVDSDGIRDLSWLGNELSMPTDPGRHACPADQPPPAPRPDPPPPPQTVTYRRGGVEHSLLDAIREYVVDAIEQEREGR